MHTRRIGLLAVILICGLMMSGAAAQGTGAPLVLLLNGDIWTWDGNASTAPRQITQTGGYVQSLTLSPDGSRVAYLQMPDNVLAALQQMGGFGGGGQLPTDIWLLDIASSTTTALAVQPQNASFAQANVPDVYLVRSIPAWSPDSTQLAWAEYGEEIEPQRVMVHDFASGLVSLYLDGLTPPYGVTAPLDLKWGTAGIVIHNVLPYVNLQTGQVSAGQFVNTIQVASVPGELPPIMQLPETPERYFSSYALVNYLGTEYIGVGYNGNLEWDLLEPAGGTIGPAPRIPTLYSRFAPDTSLGVSYPTGFPPALPTVILTDASWQPLNLQATPGYVIVEATLSPDGQAIAMQEYQPDTREQLLTVWRNGVTVTMPPINQPMIVIEFVWGSTAWRIPLAEGDIQPEVAVLDCPALTLPPRLTIGGQGRVVVGGVGANRLRFEPTVSSAVVTEIAEGEVFTVLGGPECADGIFWWEVMYGIYFGWTAEGEGTEYYLEPVG